MPAATVVRQMQRGWQGVGRACSRRAVVSSYSFVCICLCVPQLTVMLFIHGGTYVTDGISRPNYNGQQLANDNNVIVATLQYRMGVFGYAGADLLRPLSTDGSTGNYGLQDQRLGMQVGVSTCRGW